MDDLEDENWLAERWNVSKRSLQKWRVEGRGPPYLKIGECVRYSPIDIAEYERRRRRFNTSQSYEAAPENA